MKNNYDEQGKSFESKQQKRSGAYYTPKEIIVNPSTGTGGFLSAALYWLWRWFQNPPFGK